MAIEMRAAFAIFLMLFGLQSVPVLGEGGVECEKLPLEMCAFSVSSLGARCVLKKNYSVTSRIEASVEYQCQSSGIMAEKMMEWIESEECLQSCGLQRMSVGMSTDNLSQYSRFTSQLCSDKCQINCPNIVDLYLNLAAGEGIYLPHLCETHRTLSRRMMFETVAPGPILKTFSLAEAAVQMTKDPKRPGGSKGTGQKHHK